LANSIYYDRLKLICVFNENGEVCLQFKSILDATEKDEIKEFSTAQSVENILKSNCSSKKCVDTIIGLFTNPFVFNKDKNQTDTIVPISTDIENFSLNNDSI